MISVIVPFYNEEKYLNRCLDSIINQTYKDLEIILIDDGSNDGSFDIASKYESKDKRIKIFRQNNQGLSSARNKGLDNCNGEYILFVDANDEILPTMIEELYDLLIRNNCDISVCSIKQINSDNHTTQNNIETITIINNDDKYDMIQKDPVRSVVQWNKLFKRYIFDDLRFPKGRLHEDEFVIHKELYKAKSIAYTDRQLYLYYRNPESITLNMDMSNRYDIVSAYKDRIDFFKQINQLKYLNNTYCLLKLFVIITNIKKNNFNDSDNYLDKINMIMKQVDNDINMNFIDKIYSNIKVYWWYLMAYIKER